MVQSNLANLFCDVGVTFLGTVYVAERTKGFDNLPRFLVGERCSEIFKATEADCRMIDAQSSG